MKELFNNRAIEITEWEYLDILYTTETGYSAMLADTNLDSLLEHFEFINYSEILEYLCNGMLYFYTYNNQYLAVLES